MVVDTNMRKQKVILLFLDAFSSHYLHEDLCPCIFSLAKEFNCKSIEPIFAFQGIGATIYTGTWANTNKIWAEYILGNDDFFYEHQFIQKILIATDFIPNDRVNWAVRYVLYKLYGKKYIGTPNAIPANSLKFFKTCLQKKYTEKNCFPPSIKTLFDIAQENGISYNYAHPPTQFENRAVGAITKSIIDGSISDLTILHLGSLDFIGHTYGPNTNEMKIGLNKIDNAINSIIQTIKKTSKDIQLVIFSDHGMSPVHQYINIYDTLSALPVSIGKDYIMFLDSTMARFWFYTLFAKEEIIIALSKNKLGHILEPWECAKYHINKLNEEHGEIVYAVNDGVAIYPDFFRRYNPPKGMHGYAYPSDNPILIYYSEKNSHQLSMRLNSINSLKMVDIMPIVLELLNCPIPITCESVLFDH